MILGLGPWELFLLGLLVTALFGLGRLPAAARDLGRLHGLWRRMKNELLELFRFF